MKYLLIGASLLAMTACTTSTENYPVQEVSAPMPSVVEEADLAAFAAPRYIADASSRKMHHSIPVEMAEDRSRFDNGDENPVKLVRDEPVSTFSADVDTTSYAVARKYLNDGQLPPSEAVRVEEFLNYFDYGYNEPNRQELFSPTVWVTPTPWNENTQLMHIGVKGYEPTPQKTPNANIVLLLDVSGSMNQPDKLPLLKKAMNVLIDQLSEDDYVSIVTYAGRTGVVLEPTPGNQKRKIRKALSNLTSGGSTAGAAGLSLAYEMAEEYFDAESVNRIVLATDGDFNVGISSDEGLEDIVARKRKSGVFLSVLGFGQGNLNDTMMQRIAQNGNGIAAYIDNVDEARKVLGREFRSSIIPIAEDLKFQVEFNPARVKEYRLIGYQTRQLNREDFNNDAVDAGDIGSGHTVTALYEVTPTGGPGLVDELRYGSSSSDRLSESSDELAFLKIRYKPTGEGRSQLITRPISNDDVYGRFDRAPTDARFAAMVAAAGEKMARSKHVHDLAWDEMIKISLDARGDDPYGDRVGFVSLLRKMEELDSHLEQ